MRQQAAPEVLEDLVDSLTDIGLIALSEQGQVLSWNSGARALFSISSAEAIGAPLDRLLQAPQFKNLPELVAAGPKVLSLPLRSGGGDSGSVLVEVRPLASGGFALRVVRAADPEESSLAAALRISEERFRELASAIPQIVWIAKSNGDFEELNERAAEFVGVSANSLTGWSWRQAIHPDDTPLVVDAWLEILQTETPRDIEFRLRRADGVYRWHVGRQFPVRGTTGAVERWYGTCTDIDDLKRAQEVLAENDGRLVEAQRIAKMGGWSWEPASGRVWWSDTLYELMGVDRNHFQPTFDNFLSILHPDDREHAIKRVKTIFSGSNGFASDLRVIRRQDGIQIWIHSQAKVVRSADGRILRVDGTDQDITERKLAEASLRESEHRFRNVLDNSPAIIFLKDLSGRYLFVNRYGADAVSIPQEDFVGKTAAEVLPPELAEQFERNDSLVQKTLRPIQFEETAAAPNGRLIAMLTTIFPLYLSDGAPYAICGIGQDISEQKRVQEERDRLWNLSPDPLCVVGSDGFFKQLSPAWRRLLGWTEEEMLSQPWLTFVHPDDHAASVRMGERLAAGEMVTGFINRYRCRNGDYRWFSWNATYVPASQRIYGFVRDVTEEQQLSEMARRSQKMEAVGRLAGGVAHDFNNLLMVINGYSGLLLAQTHDNESQRQILTAICDAGERAARLTSQLLSFSRQAVIQPRVVDLSEVVESCGGMFRRLIGADIQLDLSLLPGAHVRIDPTQLEQVLLNLTINARDAMPHGGLLRMAIDDVVLAEPLATETGVVEPGGYRCLTVSDGGCGMSEEVVRRIFEPFFTTKSAGQGTGLGLAMVYGIVRQAGGAIAVLSTVGVGTTFEIYLPAVDEAAPMQMESTPTAAKISGPETILIAEDDPAVRRLLRRALEIQGYSVQEAGSASEAVQIAQSHAGEINLFITDMVMPDCDGGELAASIRKILPDLPVLFISGYADDRIVRDGAALQGDSFLQKPFPVSTLAERVRSLLDAPSSRRRTWNSAN